VKKNKNDDSFYLTYIDGKGEEHPCHTGMKLKKKLKLTTDNKLTILLVLWVLDKIVMAVLLYILK
jgi:hypothetical protein